MRKVLVLMAAVIAVIALSLAVGTSPPVSTTQASYINSTNSTGITAAPISTTTVATDTLGAQTLQWVTEPTYNGTFAIANNYPATEPNPAEIRPTLTGRVALVPTIRTTRLFDYIYAVLHAQLDTAFGGGLPHPNMTAGRSHSFTAPWITPPRGTSTGRNFFIIILIFATLNFALSAPVEETLSLYGTSFILNP